MREQIVMITADVAADRAGKGMRFVFRPVTGAIMVRVMQRFGDDIALEGDVSRIARACALIRASTNRAMIHDAMIATAQPGAVHRFAPRHRSGNEGIE